MGNAVLRVMKGAVDRHEAFEFLASRVRFESALAPKSRAAAEAGVLADSDIACGWVYSPERTEQYKRTPDGQVSGEINGPWHMLGPREFGMDLALGLRRRNSDRWFGEGDLKHLALRKGEGGSIVLYEEDRAGGRHEWGFDPSNGYALRSYQELDKEGVVWVEVVNAGLKNVDGVTLPMMSTIRIFSRSDGKRALRQSSELQIARYEIGAKDNVPERYRMVWPANAVIVDNQNKRVSETGEKGRGMGDGPAQTRVGGESPPAEAVERKPAVPRQSAVGGAK